MPDNDFFHDTAHPDRPQHPDFWAMANVVNQLDGRAGEGQMPLPQIVADQDIDMESLTYMANNRGGILMGAGVVGAAIWVDAFLAGVVFERNRQTKGQTT